MKTSREVRYLFGHSRAISSENWIYSQN